MGIADRTLAWRVRALASQRYWYARTQLTKLRSISAFAVAQTTSYARESRSMSWILVKTFGRILVAIVLTLLLVFGTLLFGEYSKKAAVGWTWLPVWLSKLAAWLGQPPPPTLNYQSVVTAALAVTGTLAGVYFATVAFVVSSTYKDASADVRALVTRLPGGRVYAFVYVQAVLFGLVTLALPMVDRQPNRMSLCVVTMLGGFVVLSFGRLRTQLYGLLEPVGLLSLVQSDITRWTAEASRLEGRDPTGSRVRLCHAHVSTSLETLRDLCHLIRERERLALSTPSEYSGLDSRILTAARYVQAIWLQYGSRKQVPVQLPGWCPKRPKHKDWLLSGDHEIRIALATATTLRAQEIDDVLWVERRLAQVIEGLIGGREIPQISALLNGLNDPVHYFFSCGMFAESKLWIDSVVSLPMSMTVDKSSRVEEENDDSSGSNTGPSRGEWNPAEGYRFNLVDFIALTYTQAVLGLGDYARSLSIDFPQWTTEHALGKNIRSLGSVSAGLAKNIRDGLSFEKDIEGRRITSDSNMHQLFARAIATEIIDEADALMIVFEEIFSPWAIAVDQEGSMVAGAALSRLDEALHKWGNTISIMSELFEKCEGVHRDTDDQWPDLNLESLFARCEKLRYQLRKPIVVVASGVDFQMESDRPDVFGWAFYRGHQDLLDDVLSGSAQVATDFDDRLFRMIIATDRASKRLRASVTRQHYSVLGSFRSEPNLMLLQLAGIMLVTGLVRRRTDLLDSLDQVWGRLLDLKAQDVLDVSLAALTLDESLIGISPGKIHRSSRYQQALHSISEIEMVDAVNQGGAGGIRRFSSSQIDSILRHVSFDDFEEVFVAAWLIPEARQRGATFVRESLSSKLSGFIESFGRDSSVVPSADGPADPGVEEGSNEEGE